MARARNIKPSTMDNDTLAECAPITRLLFIYLWMLADREGRIEDRPKRIAAQALPYDNVDADALLEELAAGGFILRYTVDGSAYIQILAFHKHQNPHPREAKSEIPPPPVAERKEPDEQKDEPRQDQGNTLDMPSPADSLIPDSPSLIPDPPSGTGGEAAQAQPPPTAPAKRAGKPRKVPLPADFCISDRVRRWAAEKRHGDLDRHLEAFIGKAKANGYAYADWDEAFMNAIRDNWAKVGQRQGGGRETTAEHNDRAFDEWMAGADDGRTIDA